MRAGVLSPSSTPVRFGFFPRRSPGSWFLPVSRESEAAMSAGKKNAKNNNAGDGARGTMPVHGGEGAEVAGLEVQLVSDAGHLPGRGKSDRLDCVWHCKLNERGMLMRSFVPPEPVRDLRALTRTRARLAQDQTRHQSRVEKILEDALVKVSAVISDLFGTSGRRFPGALVAGQRSPKALAALGDYRLKASTAGLEAALTGRFRDTHATEIAVHLRLIDAINARSPCWMSRSNSTCRPSRTPPRSARPAARSAAVTPPAAAATAPPR